MPRYSFPPPLLRSYYTTYGAMLYVGKEKVDILDVLYAGDSADLTEWHE